MEPNTKIKNLVPKPRPGSFNDRAKIPPDALIAIAEIIHPQEIEILKETEESESEKKEGDK